MVLDENAKKICLRTLSRTLSEVKNFFSAPPFSPPHGKQMSVENGEIMGSSQSSICKMFPNSVYTWPGSTSPIFHYQIPLNVEVCRPTWTKAALRGSRQFERIAEHCDDKLKYIPLTFMLGFFVTIVVDRWRSIFQNMGWIENLALTVTSLLRGDSKEAILYRRTIIRYAVLCQVLVFRDVSMRVRRRFPNMESLVVAGFLHENELLDLENIKLIYNKYWAPISWSLTLCMKAYKEGLFETLPAVINVQTEIKNFRASLAQLCNYDWVPIPIAYPQVVFLAVRVYFLICIVSRQFIISIDAKNKSVIDLYVPFMTMLQFTFFVGWMK
ncbi:bestrophin-1 domain protein, partial [Necator americanus]